MYNNKYMKPGGDNRLLQRKVQFDIQFFFTRMGARKEHMKVTDFILSMTTKQMLGFVKKVEDELTKNHNDPKIPVWGVMKENRDDKMCPVRWWILNVQGAP